MTPVEAVLAEIRALAPGFAKEHPDAYRVLKMNLPKVIVAALCEAGRVTSANASAGALCPTPRLPSTGWQQ